MADGRGLSDKGLAVFAFAAYHQLESGQAVTKVIREDGKGHKADDAAVDELQARELATVSGTDLVFTDAGLRVLASAVESLRQSARS
jgi:hypothetical protein